MKQLPDWPRVGRDDDMDRVSPEGRRFGDTFVHDDWDKLPPEWYLDLFLCFYQPNHRALEFESWRQRLHLVMCWAYDVSYAHHYPQPMTLEELDVHSKMFRDSIAMQPTPFDYFLFYHVWSNPADAEYKARLLVHLHLLLVWADETHYGVDRV